MSDPLILLSNALSKTTRVLSYFTYAIHLASSWMLYCLGGIAPTYHTKPNKGYHPSVIVSGAHQGIGAATALYLARHGFTVYAGVRREEDGRELLEAFKSDGKQTGEIRPVILDVLDTKTMEAAFKRIEKETNEDSSRPFVAVVNNAGYCLMSPLELTPKSEINHLYQMDLFAYIDLTRHFLPLLKKNQGRVVMIGPYGGYTDVPGWTVYCSAKAAIDALNKSWRLELIQRYGIQMTCVRPGWTRSAAIGPKIMSGWEKYEASRTSIGVSSLGVAIEPEVTSTNKEDTKRMMKDYEALMTQFKKIVELQTKLGQPADAVAQTVNDALVSPWMQVTYTVGWDAILSEFIKSIVPEKVYEWVILKFVVTK